MKTINEVLDNMRNTAIEYLNDGNESHCPYELLMSFHRDIEVAVKAIVADRDNWRRQALAEDARANVATCEKSSQVGNATKMREALENITLHFCKNCHNNGPDGCESLEVGGRSEFLCPKLKQARAALAEPLRNCEVGTAEEQMGRHDDFCMEHTERCRCVGTNDCIYCFAKWSQMPYESEVK